MLKRDLMPSSLLFMIAALAASSVVGGSTCGVEGPPSPGVIGRDVDSVMAAACAGAGLEAREGNAVTGIITTFLKDERKSRFAACR